VIIDLGTGDGRAVLAVAAHEPGSIVLGVDANAASMAERSRRAARSPRKDGLPNAVFVASAAEALPAELDGSADEVTVLFPWGSLLRGALGLDEGVAEAIAGLLKRGGRLRVVLSVAPRDGIAEIPCLDETGVADVARRQACHGLDLVAARLATAEDLAGIRSSWAGRLRSDPSRAVWMLEFRRRAAVPGEIADA
jgi:16S rRNA (adenine(1408)-N(1))-methyltransferase